MPVLDRFFYVALWAKVQDAHTLIQHLATIFVRSSPKDTLPSETTDDSLLTRQPSSMLLQILVIRKRPLEPLPLFAESFQLTSPPRKNAASESALMLPRSSGRARTAVMALSPGRAIWGPIRTEGSRRLRKPGPTRGYGPGRPAYSLLGIFGKGFCVIIVFC